MRERKEWGERSKVSQLCTTGTSHSGDHLEQFVWHKDPAITANQTRLKQSPKTPHNCEEIIVMGIVEDPATPPPNCHPFTHFVMCTSLRASKTVRDDGNMRSANRDFSYCNNSFINIQMKYYRSGVGRWDATVYVTICGRTPRTSTPRKKTTTHNCPAHPHWSLSWSNFPGNTFRMIFFGEHN